MWAVMAFGPLAHLTRLAGGLTPFDIRPKGPPTVIARTRTVRRPPLVGVSERDWSSTGEWYFDLITRVLAERDSNFTT
jgi:hypothetical protein